VTHVVTENCDGCRFTDCVTVCPVMCFHGDGQRLYIDPDGCVDCGACVPMCPVRAISAEVDLLSEQQVWLQRNAELARDMPVIAEKQPVLASAASRKSELGF